MKLLAIAIAPILILMVYIYYRDKYEKEPIGLLLKGILFGMISVIPILFAEQFMSFLGTHFPQGQLGGAFYQAFFVAALCEEAIKLITVRTLIWKNPNFNEQFDGIVYAVFVSLGFALVENLLYVMGKDGGMNVGFLRAFTAVPAHAMFGIIMGYYLGLARFFPDKRHVYSTLAFVMPFVFHGFYDFILMSGNAMLLLLFGPFLIWLLFRSRKRMKTLSDASVFK